MAPEDVIVSDSILWQVFRQAYELGYPKRAFPTALGGAELSASDSYTISEEWGWASADFAVGLGVASFPFEFAALRAAESPRLFEEIVGPFLDDREARYVGCWAITEPGHGSDTLMVGTEVYRDPKIWWGVTARPNPEGWTISGQKSAWVSNGTIATHALVFLGIEHDRGMNGGGVAVIPLELPGVSRGKPLNKLGQRALNQGEIFFDEVRIPSEYMLVEPDGYPDAIDSVLTRANAFMGATFTGLARAALEEALTYTRGRNQGGKALTEHQLVQKHLFDMYTRVESARQLSRMAMLNAGSSPPKTYLSIAAKVHCTEAAFHVASEAVQLHGGYGLVKGTLVEKLFRDARAALIEDGSNDILSLAAAQQIIDRF
jgi:alkylation response protein AidB-like acyl-CoA dehydrogenase